ncbi:MULTISPECIES: fused response regulator/phosphatase [unclassified Pseudoalteromonas]|uniref:ATP-binding SpoIIE family protein phosphatase n=1 Tax=unclassified Pseudoalteromonas TaxID=194690 RepID=UPI000C085A01|nr:MULTISPECIES: fused response regulator/phosphatase [unclassified Pseudoalteromonas]MDP2633925.1 fused response regulator/phosphatase [Pseudoalteromonas sp. 1_MG-2023]PHN88633.1 fused response regulator/phosphatase [Pseudoalteromonas sp. 3D05]
MRILVVDDQKLNRDLLKIMLEQQHYDVVTACNGIEALEVLDSGPVDIVLLDVIMPEMDGYETAPKIKQRSKDVYLPIIFITSLDDKESFERCLALGGDDFIHKPFDKIILTAKIKAHSRTRKLSLEAQKQNRLLEYHNNQTEREHDIVEHIFNNALENQHDFPDNIDFHLSPASMFNGDVFLVAQSPIGSLYCMLGDFTGHGLAAAVGALPTSKVFYTMVNKGMAVSDIANEINTLLVKLLPGNMFCAATIIELSSSGKSVSAWLGGLPDAYVINQHGNVLKTLESQHMALGILETHEFERELIHFEVDSTMRVVLATDGIIETTNDKEEYFGEHRFIDLLAEKPSISCDDIIHHVTHFAQGEKQQDDLSIVLFNCLQIPQQKGEQESYSPLPFNMSLSLNSTQIKTTDPVLEIVDVLTRISGLRAHRSDIFLLLSEAYNNAVDHGLLGLDSDIKNQEDGFLEFYQQREAALNSLQGAMIIVDMRYCPTSLCLYFTICDSGNGHKSSASDGMSLSREHGRGISLLEEIAEHVTYNASGNQIEMCYKLT